jgi:hypothetical protein
MMHEPEADNVLEFGRTKIVETETAPGVKEQATVDMLMATIEQMDQGIKLVIQVIADHDKRLRALELSVRKLERKNVPSIVNSQGERVN